MTQERATDTEALDRGTVSFWMRFRRGVFWKRLRMAASLMAIFVVMYLFATGPLLWSYSHIENKAWREFVDLTMVPIIKMENFHRYGELTPELTYGLEVSLDPWWVSGLESYWKLYGDGTIGTYASLYFVSNTPPMVTRYR